MLPSALIERLTLTGPVRTERRGSERRKSARIPCALRALVYPVWADRALAPVAVRIKDISAGGIGVIVTPELPLSNEFVARLQRGDSTPIFVQCQVRRSSIVDGVCSIAGCSFERLLSPDQTFGERSHLSALTWLDCHGDTAPASPFPEMPSLNPEPATHA